MMMMGRWEFDNPWCESIGKMTLWISIGKKGQGILKLQKIVIIANFSKSNCNFPGEWISWSDLPGGGPSSKRASCANVFFQCLKLGLGIPIDANTHSVRSCVSFSQPPFFIPQFSANPLMLLPAY